MTNDEARAALEKIRLVGGTNPRFEAHLELAKLDVQLEFLQGDMRELEQRIGARLVRCRQLAESCNAWLKELANPSRPSVVSNPLEGGTQTPDEQGRPKGEGEAT